MDGLRPLINRTPSNSPCPVINPEDLCYEQSMTGPDALFLPQASQMKFKTIKVEDQVLISCDNCFDQLPSHFEEAPVREFGSKSLKGVPHYLKEPWHKTFGDLTFKSVLVNNVKLWNKICSGRKKSTLR